MMRRIGMSLMVMLVTTSRVIAASLSVPSEYGTIQAGVDAAAVGDTVLVAPGYYADQSDRLDWAGFLNTACVHLKGGVTLLSESGPAVTTVELGSGGPGFPEVMTGWRMAGEIVIEGFSIVSSVPGVIGVEVRESPRLVLRNCIVRDLGTGPSDAGVSAIETEAQIEACVFRDLNVSGAIVGSDASRVIRDCRFENIAGSAIGISALSGSGLVAEIIDCAFVNVQPSPGDSPIGVGGYAQVVVSGCVIRDCVSDVCGGLRALGAGNLVVFDNLFVRNHVPLNGRGGAGRLSALSGTVSRNTVVACSQAFPALGGAAFDLAGTMVFAHNIVADCSGAEAVGVQSGSTVTTSCNVFWNNPQGNAFGFTLDSTDVDADPRFCDPLQDDYTVDDLSPCLPSNSGACGQIGAFGQGCGAVSVEETSWGALKGMYR